MGKFFLGFVIVLLALGGRGIWRFYQQPVDLGDNVHNRPRQEKVLGLPLLDTFIARGTEPFWAIALSGGQLVWQEPSTSGSVYSGVAQFTSGMMYMLTDSNNTIMVTLTPGICNDGMSDTQYSGTAQITFATGPYAPIYTGCAIR